VTVEKNVLTIKGDKTAAKPTESVSYASIERFSGTFERRFRLPDVVDSDRVSAAARHGLIEITVPKAEAHHPQRIAITG
jgi:HSP20 family protein